MKQCYPLLLACILAFFTAQLTAQNLVVTSVNPDNLYVCGEDELTVKLQSSSAAPVNNIITTVSLPAGVLYIAGSVAGATEVNITDLSNVQFTVPNLAVGASLTFTIKVKASCDLVNAINTGQLFNNTIKANYAGGSDQITTGNYAIETGLVVIVSATPFLLSGEKGDMLIRQIKVKNTRLGPIQSLHFSDIHFPGYTATGPGAASSGNPSPVLFEADYGAAFFSSVGDGDGVFEFNEEATLIEKITITDCGTPSYKAPSQLYVSWGCGGADCQFDSTTAEVEILPSTQNPDVRFVPVYGHPTNFCGQDPATSQAYIINSGNLPAENVEIDLYIPFSPPPSDYTGISGFQIGSFEYNNGSGWLPLTPNIGDEVTLPVCQIPVLKRALVSIPLVPANDTTFLRLKMITCPEICKSVITPFYGFTFYKKACPLDASVSDSLPFRPDTAVYKLNSYVKFKLDSCFEQGQSYPMNYVAISPRLDQSDEFIQFRLRLPKGIYWDESCGNAPLIEGKSPVFTEFNIDPEGTSEITIAYKLPFSMDSIAMPFCLKFICKPDMECTDGQGEWNPNGSMTSIFQGGCEDGCGLTCNSETSLTTTPDAAAGCGFMSCGKFIMFVDVQDCPQGGGGGAGGGAVGGIIALDYQTYRINYGLKDDDDNRLADNNAPPTLSKIRRDRYIPGDTLRFDLHAVVLEGLVTGFNFRIFTEAMASDFGIGGGDPFRMLDGRTGFVDNDSLEFLGATLTIKKANGSINSCPAAVVSFAHKRYADVAATNVSPPQIFDQLITMYRQFELDVAACSPDGQGLAPGDSLLFIYDYRINPNFVPQSGAQPPPLINFRNTLGLLEEFAYDHYAPYGPINQFSGYRQTISYPRHTIQPCTTSTEQSPFGYGIRIARPNMFPFEVRQLSEIDWLNWTFPQEVTLLTAVTDLTLQTGAPLITDLATSWTVSGETHIFDYATQVFEEQIDEGFNLVTNMTFDEACNFFGPDTTITKFKINYLDGLPDPPYKEVMRRNATGLFDGLPILKPLFGTTELDLSAPTFNFDFGLQNTRPALAPNSWVYIEPVNGSIDDVQLLQMPQNTPYPSVGNLFQLGDIGALETNQFRLVAANNNCNGMLLRLIIGWSCDPVTSPESESCGRDTIILDLHLQTAVLELDVINQPASVPLCEPSDYFTFEISNAEFGNAFGLRPSIKLPQGLLIVPGSVQIQYPAPGGTWAPISDPQVQPGNINEWNINDILPGLVNGLPGFATQPENAFRIRFKTIAECGFVANAQPVYGVDGRQPCGVSTNSLRKPDEPIGLDGVSPAYGVSISLSPSNTAGVSCGDEFEILAQILLEGTPSTGDSIYLTLPQGVSYVSGSYAGIQNAASSPQLFGQLIQVAYNSGLSAGSVVKFSFKVKYDNAAGCLDKFIVAQTRQKTVGFCAITGQNCSVYIATGEALLPIPSQNADLKITNFSPVSNAAGTGFTFMATLENPGQVNANNTVVQIVFDQNGNGQPDPNEAVVQTVNYNQTIAAGGGTATISGALNVPLEQLCKLIAVLPAEANCACAPKYFPLDNFNIPPTVIALCDVATIGLGIDSIAGHTYNWQPSGILSCANCANASFNPGPNVQTGEIFNFILTETSGTCALEHPFQVRFGGVLGITTPDQVVCKGDTVRLDATPGGTYSWTGTGVNPTAQTQFLTPTSNGTYAVTVTFPQGCTGTDDVLVTVLEPSTVDLGVLQTCPGVAVSVFGDTTSVAGTYCKTFMKANGCDSVVCVKVQVFGVSGTSTAGFCPGDSVQVFDQFVKVAGEYCKTFPTAGGCDSTHCVTVSALPPVNVGLQDSTVIIAGSSVQLNGPAGFSTYTWTPSAGLSCTDCQSPIASPDTSTNYLVHVVKAEGCSDDVLFRVVVFPPCFENINIPNAFTPDGDNINDKFRVVPFEGFEKVVGLQVYNRWGQKIYASTTNPTWDGKVDGVEAPVDVYIFIIDIECNGEVRRMPERQVSLIR